MKAEGTVFNLEKTDEGDWFAFFSSRPNAATGEIEYSKPEKGGAEFRIRSTNQFWEERRKGRVKENKMVLNPTTRAMERVSYFPDLPPEEEAKELDDAWDYAITGMKNAFSAPGVPMECNRENKMKLRALPVFVRFFFRVQEIISEVGVRRKEEVEKN